MSSNQTVYANNSYMSSEIVTKVDVVAWLMNMSLYYQSQADNYADTSIKTLKQHAAYHNMYVRYAKRADNYKAECDKVLKMSSREFAAWCEVQENKAKGV